MQFHHKCRALRPLVEVSIISCLVYQFLLLVCFLHFIMHESPKLRSSSSSPLSFVNSRIEFIFQSVVYFVWHLVVFPFVFIHVGIFIGWSWIFFKDYFMQILVSFLKIASSLLEVWTLKRYVPFLATNVTWDSQHIVVFFHQ